MKNIIAITHSKLIIILLLFLMFAVGTNAQQVKTDSIANKLSLYGIKHQSPVLFIHFDKTVYSTNENVWFTAYILNAANYNVHKTLSVALVKDDDDSAIIINDEFVIDKGFSFGNMIIPDSLITGNYSFIAYTNHLINGSPDVLFRQAISVKNIDQPKFTASLNPIDTALNIEQQKVMLLVNFTDLRKPPVSVPVKYYVGNSEHPILKGEVKTVNGQYIFNVPSKLLSMSNNRLHAQIKYSKEVKEVTFDLPAPVKPASVKFYPEGGNLVTGTPNTIGWEVKSFGGDALKVDAMLYQDNKLIDTIETSNYGFGEFVLTPRPGSNYYVKLYGVNKKDTLYKLPVAINNIPSLAIKQALVNDILMVDLRSSKPQKIYLIGHNYKQLFFETAVEIKLPTQRVKILLADIPKGLTQLTLTDSLGHPLAERTFFAHYNKKALVQINTDKSDYASRQKVILKIKLDKTDMPDSGLVSIACVQENRLEIKKKNDIESYFYLKNEIGELPVKENYLGNEEADKHFLENILLIKGWRRYTWLDMLKTTDADTLRQPGDIVYKGSVSTYNKPIKKPEMVINLNYPLNPITTNKTGGFTLKDNEIVVSPTKKILFLVNGDTNKDFQINIEDPYLAHSARILKHLAIKDLNVPQQQTTQQLAITGFEHAIQLKEVKITAGNDRAFFRTAGSNACGDYVCRNNIFNCRNHINSPGNFPPILGGLYQNLVGPYKGCMEDEKKATPFKGIYSVQEFYPSDYSQVNPSQPEYLSTIFWKHIAKVTSENEAEFSFYTSDISGKFKIVVQGITGKDVLYGEKSFNVAKPKFQ